MIMLDTSVGPPLPNGGRESKPASPVYPFRDRTTYFVIRMREKVRKQDVDGLEDLQNHHLLLGLRAVVPSLAVKQGDASQPMRIHTRCLFLFK